MKPYYVNTQAQYNGDHEVHTADCHKLPLFSNRRFLGDYTSCYPAVVEARKQYSKVNGCVHCCKACHTS